MEARTGGLFRIDAAHPDAKMKRFLSSFMNYRMRWAAVFLTLVAGVGVASLPVSDAASSAESTGPEAIERRVKDLLVLLKNREFRKLESKAAQFATSAPAEARFLYLQAEALDGLNRGKEAETLREQALRLNPSDEAAHMLAAEMLADLKRWLPAAIELELVLHIPPVVGVNDVNAYLHLADILVVKGEKERAADYLESALDLYRTGRAAGLDISFQGGDEQALEAKVRGLRGKKVSDDGGDVNPVSVNIAISFKGGKIEEAQRAIKEAALIMTVEIEPFDIRVLDLSESDLRYRPEDGNILLGDVELGALSPPSDHQAKDIHVVLRANDCYYIYRLAISKRRFEKVARYEKDYTIRLNPSAHLRALRNVTVKVNGMDYKWNHLLEGVPFDVLPKKLEIEVKGINTAGRREQARMEVEISEPIVFPQENPKKPSAAPPASKPRFRKQLSPSSKGDVI